MSLARLVRILAEKRRQSRRWKEMRIARQIKSEAALRGVSTQYRRRGAAARKLYAN